MNDGETRRQHYRLATARNRLTTQAMGDAGREPLQDIATHCLALAHLETDPARIAELAAVAAGIDETIDRINALAGRAWAVARADWAPSAGGER